MYRGLSQFGLRATGLVRMVLRQVVLRRRRFFHGRIPRAETIGALSEPTHDLKQFESVDELFAEIEARAPRHQ